MKTLTRIFIITVLCIVGMAIVSPAQEISLELLSKLELYRKERIALQKDIKAIVQSNPATTREEKQTAIISWRKVNADRIQAHKENTTLIRSKISNLILKHLETLGDVTNEERQIALDQWKEQNFGNFGLFKDRQGSRMDQMRKRFKDDVTIGNNINSPSNGPMGKNKPSHRPPRK